MANDVIIRVEDVGKKFCPSLKGTLVYGVQDVASSLFGISLTPSRLRRDEFWVLKELFFEVKRGECVGLIGSNGAGKSTLLKLLNGVMLPDKGTIWIRGRVGGLLELGAGFHPLLTGRENIHLNAAILGLSKKEIEKKFDAIVDFAELQEFIDKPVKYYSSGMYLRLGFAVAAHVEPTVLLVDEVLAVGDVSFRMKCFERILNLRERGTAIILVSHQMADISRICGRAILLDHGRIIADGSVPSCIAGYDHLLLRRAGKLTDEGEGPLRVKSVTVLNSTGVPCRCIRTGQEMVIEVIIECFAPVPRGRIRVYIESARYGLLAGFSTAAAGIMLDFTPPLNRVRLRLPKAPFKVGGYSVGVGLFGAGPTGLLFNQPGLAAFEVTEPVVEPFGFSNDGIIEVEHRWEHGWTTSS